jgi:anti-sigma factor RsiW
MPSLRGLGQPGDRDVFADGKHRYAIWDAAYVLGSLSPADRREFEAHMANCQACRQAVAKLSGMPAILSQLDGNSVAAMNGGRRDDRPDDSPTKSTRSIGHRLLSQPSRAAGRP